ncbi:MAG TPA: AbrB/MazE/SpoVT family DNA-binding domain-containing protein [Acidimicrobiia bacterium]|jgi:antitoxin MazE
MKTRIAKWGNSLAVRVPQPFAEEVGLEEGGEVELSLVDGKLVLSPSREEWSLDRLVAGITKGNVHSEIDTGPAMGREIW